ncbi:hypothetical protein PZH43_15670, partial [Streptococcus gordonii]|nr:hypothetical protein [Streptococcus gordonii]
IVLSNTAINLRVPSLVLYHQLGTAQTASLILSAMQLIGIVAGVIVLSNTAINLRVPSLVLYHQLGTAQTASLILSAMQLIGIVAG